MRPGRAASLVVAVALVGCSHALELHPRDGRPMGQGVAQETGKTVTITAKEPLINEPVGSD